MNTYTWVLDAGTDQARVGLDTPLLEVDFQAMFNSLIIPTTSWMGMMVTNKILVDAEAGGRTMEEIRMLTSNTLRSSSVGGLA